MLQGQAKQEQSQAQQQVKQYVPQQQQQQHLHHTDPQKTKHVVIVDAPATEASSYYQEEPLVKEVPVGAGGGGSLHYQPHPKVTYVPIYQHYQHQVSGR